MKFLVWGWKGWIGGQVMDSIKSLGHEGIGALSRADRENDVAEEIEKVKPDRVICLIGRTRGDDILTIDYLEQKGKLRENIQDNLWGPLVIANACSVRHIHVTYMGTGCIFHYDDDQHQPPSKDTMPCGFTEKDDPNFFGSSYSTVKGFTDRIMRTVFAKNVLNVRIRMPITADDCPYNFITKIVNYQKVVNIPNSMTVLPQLLPVMVDMSAKGIPGTINLTNPGAISHNEVLEFYRKHVDPSFTWENFSVEEQAQILRSERSNNLLDTTLLHTLYPDIAEIHVAVEMICKEIGSKFPHGVKKKQK